MARRRTTVTATIFDTEGYAFITFRGNPQDVGDVCAIYVMNIAQPLGIAPLIEITRRRAEEDE